MKLNKYISWIAGCLTLLSGCADDDFYVRDKEWDGSIPDEITFTLNIPDPDIVALGGTRGEDSPISSVSILQYDSDGDWIGNIRFADITPEKGADNSIYQFKATLDSEVSTVQILANYDVATDVTDATTLTSTSAALANYSASATSNGPIMWGMVKKDEMQSGSTEVTLRRQAAKVTVENAPNSNFTLSGFCLVNVNEKGTVAPKVDSNGNTSLTIPTGLSKNYTSAMSEADGEGKCQPLYMFETDAEPASKNPVSRIVVKGIYNGETYYYAAAFRARSKKPGSTGSSENPGTYTYSGIPVMRNNWYKLTIEEVRGEGWKTLDEAKTALPDNRATLLLTVETEDITNMVATRDYMLGVSNEAIAEWNGSAKVAIVSSYASTLDQSTIDGLPVKLSTTESWIKLSEEQKSHVIGNSSVTYTITLDPNDDTTEDREGEILVTLGKLTRTVKIIQEGCPLQRNRKAFLQGLGSSEKDYYPFIDNDVQGIADSDNRKAEREDALIFAAVPAYTLWYKIPKESGDQLTALSNVDSSATGSQDFYVTSNGSNWEVHARTTNTPHIAQGEMTIRNGEKNITYDLLQCGYFHELTSAHTGYQTPAVPAKTGWFYYEVVKLGDYYTLDRNIGASSNATYGTTGIHQTDDDPNSIGGYFIIDFEKGEGTQDYPAVDDSPITDSMGMKYTNGRFIVASENELKKMGILNKKNFGSGAVSLNTTEGLVKDSKIYFPAAGYYYGDAFKNDLHVNLWTRTLLCGTQGLMQPIYDGGSVIPADDEYGTQFRALDIAGGIAEYAGFRMANGAEGLIKENLMRYMPLRVIWTDKTSNTGDAVGSEDARNDRNKVTIMLENNANWNTCRLIMLDSQNKNILDKAGKPMQKVSYNGKKYFMVEVTKSECACLNDDKDATISFKYGNGTTEITKDYYEVFRNTTQTVFFYKNSTGTTAPTYNSSLKPESIFTTPGDPVTVYVKNAQKWGPLYLYGYTGSNFNAAWPGAAMYDMQNATPSIDGWYRVTINRFDNIIVNNGSGTQTATYALKNDVANGETSVMYTINSSKQLVKVSSNSVPTSADAFDDSGTVSGDDSGDIPNGFIKIVIYQDTGKSYDKIYIEYQVTGENMAHDWDVPTTNEGNNIYSKIVPTNTRQFHIQYGNENWKDWIPLSNLNNGDVIYVSASQNKLVSKRTSAPRRKAAPRKR